MRLPATRKRPLRSAGGLGLGEARPTLSASPATLPRHAAPRTPEGYYRQALALAEPRGMRPLVAHCHLGLAKMHRLSGKREQAHEHLTITSAMYREMNMTYWVEQATAEMRQLG